MEQIELNLNPLKYSGSFNDITEAAQKTFATKIRIVTKTELVMQYWWKGSRSQMFWLIFLEF